MSYQDEYKQKLTTADEGRQVRRLAGLRLEHLYGQRVGQGFGQTV